MSATCPNRSSGFMARVFPGSLLASILKLSGSISANTGRAPARATQLAVAKKVKAGTITSSPLPIPTDIMASSSASVPEAQATPWRRPQSHARVWFRVR